MLFYATFDYTRTLLKCLSLSHPCPRVYYRSLTTSPYLKPQWRCSGDSLDSVKATHEFGHSGVTPTLPEGGRARLYHRPDPISNSADWVHRVSRCFHLWHQRITGVNVKVRSTDCSPTVMHT